MPTDNFDRANDADLGSNWEPLTGLNPMVLESNMAKAPSTGATYAERYQANTPTDDQETSLTLGDTPAHIGAAQGGGPACRMSADEATCYMAFANRASTGRWVFSKCVAGGVTQLGNWAASPQPLVGQRLAIRAVGTTISMHVDGVEQASTTDAAIMSGQGGLWAITVGFDILFDDWVGGDYPPPDPDAPADFWLAPIIPGVVG